LKSKNPRFCVGFLLFRLSALSDACICIGLDDWKEAPPGAFDFKCSEATTQGITRSKATSNPGLPKK